MEDFIPLLILLFLTIFSAMGKKKSKNKVKPKKAKKPSILEDLMDQLKIEDKKEEEIPNAVIIEEDDRVEPQNIREYISERNEKSTQRSTREGVSSLQSRRKVKDEIKLDEIKDLSLEKNKTLDDFDLKKAVIYSEILDRKYV